MQSEKDGYFGPIAQLVEQLAHNRTVPGSSPGGPTGGRTVISRALPSRDCPESLQLHNSQGVTHEGPATNSRAFCSLAEVIR